MPDKREKFKEIILILSLGIIIYRIFFSQRRASVYDIVALIVLLIWRFIIAKNPSRSFPKNLVVSVFLYMISDFVGALLSDNRYWELTELRKYVHVFIGGLLFTTPMETRTRKILVALFFFAAVVAGVEGIWQHLRMGIRSQGSLPHPILYAETLALACGSAVVMFFYKSKNNNRTKIVRFILLLTALLTLSGILFSESRGVWIALIVACTGTLFLYDRRISLIFISCTTLMLLILFYFSIELRERVTLIFTSAYTEDVNGSTGNRIELWKGALMIFKESPILGCGSGNFEPNIKKLIQEKKLKQMPFVVHAHNIFLQALATRGIIGFTLLAAICTALTIWGINEIKSSESIGGYIIFLSTILTIIGGLTEYNLGITKYLAAFCFTIGLLGPLRGMKKSEKVIAQNEKKCANDSHINVHLLSVPQI